MTFEKAFELYGAPGGIIFTMAVVIVFLYKERNATLKALEEMSSARLQDAKDYATKVMELSNQVITTARQLNDLFDRTKRSK